MSDVRAPTTVLRVVGLMAHGTEVEVVVGGHLWPPAPDSCVLAVLAVLASLPDGSSGPDPGPGPIVVHGDVPLLPSADLVRVAVKLTLAPTSVVDLSPEVLGAVLPTVCFLAADVDAMAETLLAGDVDSARSLFRIGMLTEHSKAARAFWEELCAEGGGDGGSGAPRPLPSMEVLQDLAAAVRAARLGFDLNLPVVRLLGSAELRPGLFTWRKDEYGFQPLPVLFPLGVEEVGLVSGDLHARVLREALATAGCALALAQTCKGVVAGGFVEWAVRSAMVGKLRPRHPTADVDVFVPHLTAEAAAACAPTSCSYSRDSAVVTLQCAALSEAGPRPTPIQVIVGQGMGTGTPCVCVSSFDSTHCRGWVVPGGDDVVAAASTIVTWATNIAHQLPGRTISPERAVKIVERLGYVLQRDSGGSASADGVGGGGTAGVYDGDDDDAGLSSGRRKRVRVGDPVEDMLRDLADNGPLTFEIPPLTRLWDPAYTGKACWGDLFFWRCTAREWGVDRSVVQARVDPVPCIRAADVIARASGFRFKQPFPLEVTLTFTKAYITRVRAAGSMNHCLRAYIKDSDMTEHHRTILNPSTWSGAFSGSDDFMYDGWAAGLHVYFAPCDAVSGSAWYQAALATEDVGRPHPLAGPGGVDGVKIGPVEVTWAGYSLVGSAKARFRKCMPIASAVRLLPRKV